MHTETQVVCNSMTAFFWKLQQDVLLPLLSCVQPRTQQPIQGSESTATTSSLLPLDIVKCMQNTTRTRTRTNTRTYAHAHTHTLHTTQTHKHTQTHAHAQTHAHTQTYAHYISGVLSFCDCDTIFQCARVCKAWKEAAMDEVC